MVLLDCAAPSVHGWAGLQLLMNSQLSRHCFIATIVRSLGQIACCATGLATGASPEQRHTTIADRNKALCLPNSPQLWFADERGTSGIGIDTGLVEAMRLL